MATGCDKTNYGDDEHCDDDYNGDGEEGGEVKTETTKEPKTKRPVDDDETTRRLRRPR